MSPAPADGRPGRITRAAFVYFCIVFAVAFGLGVVRTLFVAPRLGAFGAVAVEVPIMLTVAWWVSRRCMDRFKVPARVSDRLAVGALAFALLMLVEATMASTLFGRTFSEQLAGLVTAAGVLGLAGQVGFALIPPIQGVLGQRADSAS